MNAEQMTVQLTSISTQCRDMRNPDMVLSLGYIEESLRNLRSKAIGLGLMADHPAFDEIAEAGRRAHRIAFNAEIRAIVENPYQIVANRNRLALAKDHAKGSNDLNIITDDDRQVVDLAQEVINAFVLSNIGNDLLINRLHFQRLHAQEEYQRHDGLLKTKAEAKAEAEKKAAETAQALTVARPPQAAVPASKPTVARAIDASVLKTIATHCDVLASRDHIYNSGEISSKFDNISNGAIKAGCEAGDETLRLIAEAARIAHRNAFNARIKAILEQKDHLGSSLNLREQEDRLVMAKGHAQSSNDLGILTFEDEEVLRVAKELIDARKPGNKNVRNQAFFALEPLLATAMTAFTASKNGLLKEKAEKKAAEMAAASPPDRGPQTQPGAGGYKGRGFTSETSVG